MIEIPFNTIVLFGLALFLIIVLLRTIKIVPQKQVKIIERLGKFHRTADAGLNTVVPFLDSVRATIDLREQITKIEPQPVITRDNVTMEVDAVIYYLIADPVRATYEVQNLTWGLEQLTLSALRNVIGQLDLDHTLASRDTTNSQLRAALDTATQQWGVKVMRIELKNITPPEEIRLTMEKQMTAERTRRAVVTTARRVRSAVICFSIVNRISSGGVMFFSSMRITFTPHCCVAVSSAARSAVFVESRDERV